MNRQQIVKQSQQSTGSINSDCKAPSHIASAIAMQLMNLYKSKCETSRKLARAREMKFTNLQKQARQFAGSQMQLQRSLHLPKAIAIQCCDMQMQSQ